MTFDKLTIINLSQCNPLCRDQSQSAVTAKSISKQIAADAACVVEDAMDCHQFFLCVYRVEQVVVTNHHAPKEWVNFVGLANIWGFL